ncbi:hypothetical protein [Dictyobacter formicarum]|uniref:Nitrogen fixation protein FixH n=1 Tax=Dictyobacter formicarum TaxID=2778368 RepID=A0ABQ3VRM8_9CHLR|nr:hypothetical protein [Dictyobacter formicarum]GHO88238.1 hypothetical protein KSZ_62440 [Dictyobacter formicarum]
MSNSTYLGYEVDVEDYQPASRPAPITRPGTSTRRYQTTDSRPAARPAGATLTRRATRDRATDSHLSPRLASRSQQSDAQKIKRQPTRPHYPQPEPEQHQPRMKLHPAVWVGGGMCLLLLAFVVFVNAYVWWMNAVSDPGYYTQSAHRDVVTVHTQQSGHTEQVRAFVDGQGHLDALMIPDGDMSKSRILQGPALSGFTHPQEAMLEVTSQGDVVDIEAVGPYGANGLAVSRPQTSWSVNVTSAIKSGK